ncbi:S8 family peptidase [Xanthomonas citri pv. mangiferaeindicae]|uniref:S8 family peptidase n=1 Tax=Xanthomonas citri TaxID=346 RepID=UPI0003F743EF|nr:S8 family peptidase [Xanthomonas citri]MCC4631484.1 S8 family peptidase [Xanthomonas citri]WAW88505.1 S8 family peptidase [Xanthomonas citri pv. malvacearum]WAW92644.1 S8 family peptidase [Xanthomonas citri pv. malvacearum]WAW96809.1 S8 family peptidase [Xanthomonas citri pv. malvacearum]
MAEAHNFEHLPLLLRYQGKARLRGGGDPSPQTLANKGAQRQAHSVTLDAAAQSVSANWQARKAQRQVTDQTLPEIPAGIPILLQIDTGLDLDALRAKFQFEIVAEQEDGYVIVASEDTHLTTFRNMAQGFAVTVRGSATIAEIHALFDDPNQTDRLGRILSDQLMASWGTIGEDQHYIVDIGIACSGTQEIPPRPVRGKRATDAQWAAKEYEWSERRTSAYNEWDDIKIERERSIQKFTEFYQAEILHMMDSADFDAGVLPDSFTVRLKISGKGLKDFVLNYPYIFEVVEPEDIALPQHQGQQGAQAAPAVTPLAPDADAPAVCVIDSGIQEAHFLLQPGIDQAASYCFLPGQATTAVADEVAPGGHGTRVAGAVLYGENVPVAGAPQLPFWIQNARVLDAQNAMPVELFPPEALRKVVERFNDGPRQTRVFNHSINARSYCRTRYMSSWAAEIDQLCNERDVLIVQSAGNLPLQGTPPFIGIADHLTAGRDYPAYLAENAARIANPGQSLQALTVGSIAYDAAEQGAWRTFATQPAGPSAFSRTGPGIWNVIKPEVVEYGGDAARTNNAPPDIQVGGVIPSACPNLIRSTLHGAGPAADRDTAGTSYAAPKVARIAAQVQRVLPAEPTLLYRALVVQSAQWPAWAEEILALLRNPPPNMTLEERKILFTAASNAFRCLGFGIPDEARATTNTDHRTTLITSGDTEIHAGECHVYQVPIPAELRNQADEFDIRIDVTLSYVAQPRRTRRNLRRYLSTWVDWKASKLGEELHDFRVRAMKDAVNGEAPLSGSTLPWALHDKPQDGLIRDFKRNSGTVQKDWAVVRSNSLPDHFCIAVVGHQGWSHDPDSTARYVLAVTFEILGGEMMIYEPLRAAIAELQAQTEEVEAQAELEVGDDD